MTTETDTRRDAVWQAEALSSTYLDGVRGAIPLAAEQIDILVRLARAARPAARAILDLGCGDGILGHALLDAYAAAEPAVVLADFSRPMLDAARARFAGRADTRRRANGTYEAKDSHSISSRDTGGDKDSHPINSRDASSDKDSHPISSRDAGGDSADRGTPHIYFTPLDYAKTGWDALITTPPLPTRYDVVVSGFSIHHQPDPVKLRIYADIYDLLAPGGVFLNLEHVASASRWGEVQFEAYFIDALARYHAPRGKTRGQVAADFYHRPDKDANRLAPLETQLQWLRDLGFQHVDCFFKVFELALFGGVRGE